jgi:hypothetical protein
VQAFDKPLSTSEGLFFFPIYHLSHFSILGFNPMRKSAFRDEDLPPYPTDTAVKAIAISPKDESPNSSFCEGWVARGELSDGDEVVNTYGGFCSVVMNLHSVFSFKI